MTKTLLETYLPAYSKQLTCNSELKIKIEQLEKKFEIATKAFEDITLANNMPSRVYMFNRLQQALKEMEEVK